MSNLDASAIHQIKGMALAAHLTDDLKNVDFPVAVLPDDYNIENLERFNKGRSRFRGSMETTSIADFVRYSISNAVGTGVTCFINAERMEAKTIFNIGTIDAPGHADHRATVVLQKTSPFEALLQINECKNRQKELAEWLEDWRDYITAFDADGNVMDIKKAVAAVRCVTIEALSSSEHEDQDFSGKRSLMQSVEARSKDVMPVAFEFVCTPYEGLSGRRFKLRYSILTSDTPLFVLRIIQLERHEEEMAMEFRDLLSAQFEGQPVETFIGTFSA